MILIRLTTNVYDMNNMERIWEGYSFLTDDVFFQNFNYGLIIFTVDQFQVNINILVPVSVTSIMQLLQEVKFYLSTTYEDHAWHYRHLKNEGADDYAREFGMQVRRLIPSSRCIPKTCEQHEDGRVFFKCCNQDIFAVSCIDRNEVSNYKPLRTLCANDAIDTVYWHRFINRPELFTFKNDYAPIISAPPFAMLFSGRIEVTKIVHRSICDILFSFYSTKTHDIMDAVSQEWVPLEVREDVVASGTQNAPLDDKLVVTIATYFSDYDSLLPVLKEIKYITEKIRSLSKIREINTVGCRTLVNIMRLVDHKSHWRKWICQSGLLRTRINNISLTLLAELFERNDMQLLRVMFIRILRFRIRTWTSHEVELVRLLCQVERVLPANMCDVEMHDLQLEFDSISEDSREKLDKLLVEIEGITSVNENARSSSQNRKKLPNRKHKIKVPQEGSGSMERLPFHLKKLEVDSTHVLTFERLKRQFPSLQFELIGSGVFSNKGDLDVVITVSDATTLQEAYSHVSSLTGWVLSSHNVDEKHVTVLCGIFEGVEVDAQVWRGDGHVCSRSETLTQEAIQLTRRLKAQLDRDTLVQVNWMHEWCDVASLKNHKLCRLPGIGTTCATIILWSILGSAVIKDATPAINGHRLLESMRDCLTSEIPLIEFDLLKLETVAVKQRCIFPLTIMVNARNCCNRMTAATTRHMLDIVAYALSGDVDLQVMDRKVYAEWRRQHMVVCTRMKPLTTSSVALSLLQVASALDAHPFIDTLYFSEESVDENLKGVITVMCTLRTDVDVSIYGFGPDCTIDKYDSTKIEVSRKSRQFILALSPRPPTKSGVACATMISDMLGVPGMDPNMSFPNLWSLTFDVNMQFDTRLWRSIL